MSETYIDTIIDENGNEMHPVTETKAVHLPEGRRLQDVMVCKGNRPLDPSVPVSPIDADMLGGHEVEYFATVEMLTDEITRAKAAESAINNSLTPHDITINVSNGTKLTGCRMVANTYRADIYMNVDAVVCTSNWWDTFLTFDAKYAPINNIIIPIVDSINDNKTYKVLITPDGKVQLHGDNGVSVNVRGAVSYFIKK